LNVLPSKWTASSLFSVVHSLAVEDILVRHFKPGLLRPLRPRSCKYWLTSIRIYC
jgi:hypothetical protein